MFTGDASYYLENTENGHNKWWCIIKLTTSGGEIYEAYYGAIGKINSKPTVYSAKDAEKKLREKISKGYKERSGAVVRTLSDLDLIQSGYRRGGDGWQVFKNEEAMLAPATKREPKSSFNFMKELQKI